MHGRTVNRRLFLACGVSAGAQALPPPERETTYAFATTDFELRMNVEFYDRYSTSGFPFRDLANGRRFCLSSEGQANQECPSGFVGSLAVARYSFHHYSNPGLLAALREHVLTIDYDSRLPYRPPFDRTIEVRGGVASDIQAFGYETPPPTAEASGPWYYFRQDLYLAERPKAFLVMHWRHTLSAIRLLDVIPGEGTRPLNLKK